MIWFRIACILTPSLFCTFTLHAQMEPDTGLGDALMERYLAARTDDLSSRFLDGAKTLAQWQKKRPRLKEQYLDMLGLWPLPERTPLHATVMGTVKHEGVIIDKLHYQSRPGLYVTANLYRPQKTSGRLPAILYVCGHSGRGRDGNKTAFQDHGLWFANNGYLCLIVDTLQLGEIPGIHHGTYREGRWWWQALGYTPAGVECWNGIRGLDYLCSRPDVDPQRLGVTGISGGGASTFWIAAADERVRCAVPVSGMSDLESYVKNKVINGHCDCMFLVNTYQWDWTTIAALVAPRPLLFANSDQDPIFPMDGNCRIIAKLRRLYQMYRKPDLVDDYVSKGGHDYRPDLRIAIFQWLNKHLKNDTRPVQDTRFKPLPGMQLRVFPTDKDVPKDAINGRVDEVFIKKAIVQLPEAGQFEQWKKGMRERLAEKSFQNFHLLGLEKKPLFDTWSLKKGAQPKHKECRNLFILDREEKGKVPTWAKAYLGEGGDVFVYPRGFGIYSYSRKSPPNYVERSHALLGQTVDEGRVRDIVEAAASSTGAPEWRIIGRGKNGVLGAYAALLYGEKLNIREVVILRPPITHWDGPIFLNVLRTLDTPEGLGLLAPEIKLTLVDVKDKAFDRTAKLYKLAGAEKQFQRRD
jgi:dienelactone hydrolase